MKILKRRIRKMAMQTMPANNIICVNVRWFDGYIETFEASEVRFGNSLIWMRLSNGGNRHIPLGQVRWFSVSPESHEKIPQIQYELKL
jgi:hypothetical protein